MTVLDLPAAVGRMSIRVPRWLLVLGGFSALAAALFWPWLAHLSTALIGPPEDNMQDFWNSWHAATATGLHDFAFTRQMRWPEGTSLAYHSFAWPQVAAVALLAKIFGAGFTTLVALQNLTLLASFPLAAVTMFYLARHLLGDVEGRDVSAAVAGFVFAFNPWHVAQVMHHAHVATIEFIPLFVLCHLRALEHRAGDREGAVARATKIMPAAAMMALNALACWYFFFYALYFMAFHLLYLRIHAGAWPSRRYWVAPALCTAGAALLLTPWIVPMLASGGKSDVYYVGANMFVADAAAWLAFPPTHLLASWGSGVYVRLTGNPWEDVVYLGLANVALVIWALRNNERRKLYYALGGTAFFAVIASGEALHVAGTVTPLHLPGLILGKLPFFANVRTPARAMVFVYLFLGLALAQACMMARRKPWLPMLLALMLLDFVPAHLSSTPAACPAGLGVIAHDADNAGVLDLPLGYENGNAAMMLSACHGHAIVQGETARKMGATLLDRLSFKDLAAQKQQLLAAHVKYVVLHRGALFQGGGDWRGYPHVYRTVYDSGDVTVLRVY
jgi:hypothetical protein